MEANSLEDTAKAIEEISSAAETLLSSRLQEKTLYLLIQHSCPQAKRPTLTQIRDILQAARDLSKNCLKSVTEMETGEDVDA